MTTKTRDHFIDIETLSVETDAAIVAIGVQEFDLESGTMGRKLYREIVVQTALKSGARVDGSTLIWWMRQSPEARELFTKDEREAHKFPMAVALDELSTFLRATPSSVPRVWARGTHFDIAVLEWNFRHSAIALAVPWDRQLVFDIRTLVDLAQKLTGFDQTQIPREGIHHHAQHDAAHDAKVACAAFKAMRNAMSPLVTVDAGKVAAQPEPKPQWRYWAHPESDSMVRLPYDDPASDPLLVEVDEATYKKWSDEQL